MMLCIVHYKMVCCDTVCNERMMRECGVLPCLPVRPPPPAVPPQSYYWPMVCTGKYT